MAAVEGSAKRKRNHKVIVAPTPPQRLEISTPKSGKQPDREVIRKEEILPSKKRKSLNQSVKEKPVEVAKPAEDLVLNWITDDLSQLIERVSTQVPKVDVVKYNTQVEKVDWSQVAFGNHTNTECREKWKEVASKLRRFRVLSEIIGDAREWVKHPWMSYTNAKSKSKHPGLPKKPLTPYFRYFLEKREKYSKDNPNMSMTDLAKLLAKVFSDLPEKKKQKYKDNYLNDRQNYQRLMEKFKEEHPDMFPEETKTGKANVKRPLTVKAQGPFALFLADKMAKFTNLDPAERKEYEEKYRDTWKSLSDHKKIKWIKKTSAYEKSLAAVAGQTPTEPVDPKGKAKKSLLTKAERELLDKESGKPEKPPSSGYSLFSKILLKELKDYPTNKKMGEIARRWRELSDKGKLEWANKAQEAAQLYRVEYATYLSSLPEDERKNLESQKKSKVATKVKVVKPDDKRAAIALTIKRPKSAVLLYQQDKLPAYKLRYPQQSESEIKRLLTKEFSELSDKKKEKYKKMLVDVQKQNGNGVAAVKTDPRKPQLYKGEPKKPPSSGYMLYSGEMLGKVDSKQRMTEISQRWKALTPAEQEKYKKKQVDLKRKYEKDFEKFLSALSDHDRKQYDDLQKAKKLASQGKNAKAQAAKVELIEDSEDEEEDDDNKGSDKDDSSNDSDSDSDSSSSDGSDKSDSGSDSDSKSDADSSSNSSDSDTKDGSSDSSSDDDSDSEGSDADSSSGSDK